MTQATGLLIRRVAASSGCKPRPVDDSAVGAGRKLTSRKLSPVKYRQPESVSNFRPTVVTREANFQMTRGESNAANGIVFAERLDEIP